MSKRVSVVLPVLASILILGSLGLSQQAFAVLTPTAYVNDPTSCDPFFGPPISDEIGEGTVGLPPFGPFPIPEELDVLSQTFAELGTCPSFNGAAVDFVIEIRNLSGKSWEHVVYVTDSGLGIGGHDGFVNGEQAVEIDTFGVNVVLLSESIIADNIWQPLEIWEFVLQDFGGPGPFTLNSTGIAALSPTSIPSTGSIIVWNEGSVGGIILPIDSTSLLLAGAYATASWMIPVIMAAAGFGILLTLRKNH